MKFRHDFMKGHIEPIILSALEGSPIHAYALIRRIEHLSLGVFQITRGTIYPVLHRLQKLGWVESRIVEQAVGQARRVYKLTQKGRQQLEKDRQVEHYFLSALRLMLKLNGENHE